MDRLDEELKANALKRRKSGCKKWTGFTSSLLESVSRLLSLPTLSGSWPMAAWLSNFGQGRLICKHLIWQHKGKP